MILRITLFSLCLFVCFQLSYSQELLEVEGAIILKDNNDDTPSPGTLRFNASTQDFEGWTGSEWVSLTKGVMGSYYFKDEDQDGYGDALYPVWVPAFATPPSFYITDTTDCNDLDSLTNPGATEVCDGMDNNCNQLIDEGYACGPLTIDSVFPQLTANFILSQHVAYVSGLSSLRTPVTLELDNGSDPPEDVPFDWNLFDSAKISFVLPDGLNGGTYDIKLTSSNTDTTTYVNGITVLSVLTVNITSIDTNMVPNNQPTVVQLESDMEFIETPTVYIQQSFGATQAFFIWNVVFISNIAINCTIPQGLPLGVYDIIVINPDQSMGILPNAFSVVNP